jgi:hypothetical protein
LNKDNKLPSIEDKDKEITPMTETQAENMKTYSSTAHEFKFDPNDYF